ncbi:abortive infection protein [Clostridia bacterium]|nr:abortive infection protein [Clostridia bacterium]
MSSKAMSLKAKLRNMAKEKNITAQVLLQNYMFERFLERLSKSTYKDSFILKGGMLIAAIVGVDMRSTMDLDTTLRNMSLDEASIRMALFDICETVMDDDVHFIVGSISSIRPDDVYGGYRASLVAVYDTIETPLMIDITTGDAITPNAVRFSFCGMFDHTACFDLWAYNIETVIAEKVEAALSKSVLNTRARDYYDIYILLKTQQINRAVLKDAIAATAAHRGSSDIVENSERIIRQIAASAIVRQMWDKYRKDFSYAKDIEYTEVIDALTVLCTK